MAGLWSSTIMGRLFKRGDRWGIDYTDELGRRIRKVVAADKSVAQKYLADALSAVERIRAGVLRADPREAKRPITKQFEAYAEELARKGRDNMYAYTIGRRLSLAAEALGWQRLLDCTPDSILRYLSSLAKRGLTPKTVNGHLADLSAFFAWCVRSTRLEANPCQAVPKTADKRPKTRRALSVAECRALIAAAPPDRAVVYEFLVLTGLRRAEAAQICWMDMHLDCVNPRMELPAAITKSGEPESVPLIPSLAETLVRRRGKADASELVFDAIPSMELFRGDLAAAKIKEVDERGRRVVLHSLRHSLATMLAASSVPMAVAQRIMRHRDIRLTAQTYTDEALLPLAAAMASLPSLSDRDRITTNALIG
jgi:integrase